MGEEPGQDKDLGATAPQRSVDEALAAMRAMTAEMRLQGLPNSADRFDANLDVLTRETAKQSPPKEVPRGEEPERLRARVEKLKLPSYDYHANMEYAASGTAAYVKEARSLAGRVAALETALRKIADAAGTRRGEWPAEDWACGVASDALADEGDSEQPPSCDKCGDHHHHRTKVPPHVGGFGVSAAKRPHSAGVELPSRGDGLHWLRCVDCGREWAEKDSGAYAKGSRVCGGSE